MNRTIRVAISIATFASVAILGVANRAPYLGVDDAFADRPSPAVFCTASCMRANSICMGDPTGKSPGTCSLKCKCSRPQQGRACSPRDPCKTGSQCINGICKVMCAKDDDCARAEGGICRSSLCVARSAEEQQRCLDGCEACHHKAEECHGEIKRCLEKCPKMPE